MSTISDILQEMKYELTTDQYRKLEKTLEKCMNQNKHTTLTNEQLLDEYVTYSKMIGIADSTLKQYQSSVRHFFVFLNGRSCLGITKQDCKNFVFTYKNNSNVQQITIVNKIGFISPFFDWLEREDYIFKNPWRLIDKIKVPKKQKDAFSSVELSIIKDNCTSKRDRAIIEFLSATGVRVSEISNIKLKDVDFINREILIQGKGNKQRYVYFSDVAKYYIETYLETRKCKQQEDYLFTNKYKETQMSTRSFQILIDSLCKPVAIHGHPHKFRRTFCTTMVNRGLAIQNVQQMLGHSNLNTTMGYYAIDKCTIQRSYDQYMN